MLQPRRRMLLPWRCLILGAAFLLLYVYIQNMQNSCQNAASLGANLCANDSGSLLHCYLLYLRALALEVVVVVEQNLPSLPRGRRPFNLCTLRAPGCARAFPTIRIRRLRALRAPSGRSSTSRRVLLAETDRVAHRAAALLSFASFLRCVNLPRKLMMGE